MKSVFRAAAADPVGQALPVLRGSVCRRHDRITVGPSIRFATVLLHVRAWRSQATLATTRGGGARSKAHRAIDVQPFALVAHPLSDRMERL